VFVPLAHGEGWEIAATNSVNDFVRKVLEEQGNTKAEPEENGTFELHYTPSDASKKPFKISLPKRHKSSDNPYSTNNNQQQPTGEPFNLQSITSSTSRL